MAHAHKVHRSAGNSAVLWSTLLYPALEQIRTEQKYTTTSGGVKIYGKQSILFCCDFVDISFSPALLEHWDALPEKL